MAQVPGCPSPSPYLGRPRFLSISAAPGGLPGGGSWAQITHVFQRDGELGQGLHHLQHTAGPPPGRGLRGSGGGRAPSLPPTVASSGGSVLPRRRSQRQFQCQSDRYDLAGGGTVTFSALLMRPASRRALRRQRKGGWGGVAGRPRPLREAPSTPTRQGRLNLAGSAPPHRSVLLRTHPF